MSVALRLRGILNKVISGLLPGALDPVKVDGSYGVNYSARELYNINLGSGGARVGAILPQSNDKLLVGLVDRGYWNVTETGRFVNLNADGTLDTAFHTNAGTGPSFRTNAFGVQSDGKILVGGQFTAWNGVSVPRIVRLNADGTRDTAFSTSLGSGPDNVIWTIAVQDDDKIIVGGEFTSWSGTGGRNRIVRLNANGTLDTAFSTNIGTAANNTIVTSVILSDGRIVLGGNFTTWNGSTANRIVCLNSDGTVDTTFSTNAGTGFNSSVGFGLIATDTDQLLVPGFFTTYNGSSVGRFARLNSDGTLDTAFAANVGSGANSGTDGSVVQSDGKIVVVGNNTTWNGASIPRVVRLNADGTRDATFQTNLVSVNSAVNVINQFSNGDVIIAGQFNSINNNNFQAQLARLSQDGNSQVMPGLGPTSAAPTGIALQSNGDIIYSGGFTYFNGNPTNYIFRTNSEGVYDTAFSSNLGTGPNSWLTRVLVLPDDKLIVTGDFQSWNGSSASKLAVRLNPDGTRDTSFNTGSGTFSSSTSRTILQSDGKILVMGQIITWNGTTSIGGIVRLNTDGTLDTAFDTNIGSGANNYVDNAHIQDDGKIVLVGSFTTWNGATVNRIVRLNSDGTVDTTFSTNAGTGFNNRVTGLDIQPDGKIVVGGQFTTFNGTTRNRVARLNSDGTLDTVFNPSVSSGFVSEINVLQSGVILAIGQFNTIAGINIFNIAALNEDGTPNTDFNTGLALGAAENSVMQAYAEQPDGKIIIGGTFRWFAGEPIFNMARIGGE